MHNYQPEPVRRMLADLSSHLRRNVYHAQDNGAKARFQSSAGLFSGGASYLDRYDRRWEPTKPAT